MNKEYIICGYYGKEYGWEEVDTVKTKEEATKRLREYNINEPEYSHKIKVKNSK